MGVVPSTTVHTLFTALLPANSASAETYDLVSNRPMAPEEAETVRNAVPKRVREFAAGRHCARLALSRLGIEAGAIRRSPDRRAAWPAGATGSITHCDGYCAAAVMPSQTCRGLGIDAEVNSPLPGNVFRFVASPEEQADIAKAQEWAGVSHHLDRLLFSAKESVFKALFPSVQRIFGFKEVRVVLSHEERWFKAHLSAALAQSVGAPQVTGIFAFTSELVVTALVLDAVPTCPELPK